MFPDVSMLAELTPIIVGIGFLGSILGAIGGSIVSGLFGSNEADENRGFQEQMARNSHRYEVQDLIAAGLNPMLSAKLGGASTPSGSMPNIPDLGSTINNAVATSASSAKAKAEVDLVKAQTATAETQAQRNQAEAIKLANDAELSQANASAAQWELNRKMFLEEKFDAWFVEGKELEARQARAMYDHMRHSRDLNTMIFLDEFALKHGYRTFEEATHSTEFLHLFNTYMLSKLEVPKAQAWADFYTSPYGRELGPLIHSANQGLGAVGTGLSIGRRLLGH